MRLRILIPTGVLIEREVEAVTFEAHDGARTLLGRHQDYLASLAPGIFTALSGGEELYAAINRGILVKKGQEVLVSTRDGVLGRELQTLRELVTQRFESISSREETARTALARLESDLVRRLVDYEGPR